MDLRYRDVLFVFALVFGVPAVAVAEEADALNQEGIEAFGDGRFEEAAGHFANAYTADPDPIFRKSEAVAWFKAQRCTEAVTAANAFLLQWEGAPDETDEASSVVANCKVTFATDAMEAGDFELAERLLSEAEGASRDNYTEDRISAARVQLAKERQEAQEEEAAAAESTVSAPADPAPDVVDEAPPPSRVPAIATLAAGGTMVAAAVVVHVVALSVTVPRLERAATDPSPDEHTRLARRLDTSRVLVPVLYGLGAATVGVGAWLWFDDRDDDGHLARRGPAVGFSFSGRF